jgi:hypothetical protein
MESHPETWIVTLEPRRFIPEPWRLTLELCKLTLERAGSPTLEPRRLTTGAMEAHYGAVKAHP